MEEGVKFDEGKPQWHLLPIKEVEQVVRVMTKAISSGRYKPNNWQKVPEGELRYEDAMMRHYAAWKKGETSDPESGESHLAHLVCNALFLMWLENNSKASKIGVLATDRVMRVCTICGNKRCPRAESDEYICNNSNEPYQEKITVGRAFDELKEKHYQEELLNVLPPYGDSKLFMKRQKESFEKHQKEIEVFEELYGKQD